MKNHKNYLGCIISGIYITIAVVAFPVFEFFKASDSGQPFKWMSLSLNNWGDWLAGSLAPLAIFWVIRTYLFQRMELETAKAHTVSALSLQVEEFNNKLIENCKNCQPQIVKTHEKHSNMVGSGNETLWLQLNRGDFDIIGYESELQYLKTVDIKSIGPDNVLAIQFMFPKPEKRFKSFPISISINYMDTNGDEQIGDLKIGRSEKSGVVTARIDHSTLNVERFSIEKLLNSHRN